MSSEFIRILLVENNIQDTTLFTQLMDTNRFRTYPQLQYTVRTVTTLNDGLERITAGEADVVVIDLLLPETTTTDILALVKETSRKIPVIALTTDEHIETATEAISQGAQDYLIKSKVTGDLIERAVRYSIERKKIEERLNQVNDKLKHYANIVSHDLREPLRNITSYLFLLEKRYKGKVLDEKAEELVRNTLDGAKRMSQLIEDLLQFSKEEEKEDLSFEKTNMNEILDTVKKNLDQAITKSDAIITNDPLPTILAEPVQMVQVFQNIVANAIKFRKKEEPPRIHVSAMKAANEWTFSVKDNGIGIPKEQQGRIFEMFQRLHTREEYEGKGIGLASAKKNIENHGGRIWVESDGENGSTFFFTIPKRT